MHLHPARVHANIAVCTTVIQWKSRDYLKVCSMALCNKKPCKGGMDAMKILTLYSSKHKTGVSSENTVFAC